MKFKIIFLIFFCNVIFASDGVFCDDYDKIEPNINMPFVNWLNDKCQRIDTFFRPEKIIYETIFEEKNHIPLALAIVVAEWNSKHELTLENLNQFMDYLSMQSACDQEFQKAKDIIRAQITNQKYKYLLSAVKRIDQERRNIAIKMIVRDYICCNNQGNYLMSLLVSRMIDVAEIVELDLYF